MRLFAIGDIHGCARELETLLAKLAPASGDTVVFLGDYVDRGPDSRGVIDLVLDLASRVKVITLKGNHEAMFLDFLDRPASAGAGMFILNGGASTLANYARPDGSFELPKEHIDFLRSLRLCHETDTHYFVHAGVPLAPLDSFDPAEEETTLLWSRQPFLTTEYRWSKTIVHGHTPAARPELRSNRINLDTGCVYDGHLTALELPAMKFWSVEKGVKGEPPIFPRDIATRRVAMRFEGRIPVRAIRQSAPSSQPLELETLNYNQFGLLVREVEPALAPALAVGDRIEGVIGPENREMAFVGEVVRIELRMRTPSYGIKVERMASERGDDK